MNSITSAETLCMEDGTRLAAPESVSQRMALNMWLDETNPDLRYTGGTETDTRIEEYWAGYRLFEHSKTKDVSCTTCDFEDLGVSSWKSASYSKDEMKIIKGDSLKFEQCLFIMRKFTNLKQLRNCFNKHANNIHALCEYRECKTVSNRLCKFPFKYAGRSYDTCITFGMSDGESFCATEVDSNNTLTASETCQPECSVSNCPIGFHSHLESCIRVSAFHNHDIVSSVEEAENICLSVGSRLYQPRSTKSLKSLYRKNPAVFKHPSFQVSGIPSVDLRLAVGINITLNGTLTPFYRDGSKFPYELIQPIQEWSWYTDFPKDEEGRSCIYIYKGDKFINDKCNNSKISYICEARPTQTIEEPLTSCHFPFKRNKEDEWHHTCIYDKNSQVNNEYKN